MLVRIRTVVQSKKSALIHRVAHSEWALLTAFAWDHLKSWSLG